MCTLEKCQTMCTHRRIVLQENRSKITFFNPSRSDVRQIRVDGCMITDGCACDWLLISQDGHEHYVELKGCDVKHALEQLEQSISKLSADAGGCDKKAFVVSTRCPLSSPEIQGRQIYFKKRYRATLVVKNLVCETEI